MGGIEKELRKARPKLALVAPLTSSLCWGFGVINIFLGLGMIVIYKGTIAPISIASILTYPQWGVAFLLTGLMMCYALVTNRWKLAKEAQLAGLLIKTVWLIALIVRCFTAPQTILITLVWLFFAYVQAMTYIHFMPQLTTWEHNGKDKRNA